jgi:hypothetical protein
VLAQFPASWRADDSRGDYIVSLPLLILSVVQFLWAGYPEGVPEHDYLPLFALLARKLTSEEVVQVADELAAHGDPTSVNAIRQAIADLIHEQPLEADIARVSARLVAAGWQQPTPGTHRQPLVSAKRTDRSLETQGRRPPPRRPTLRE